MAWFTPPLDTALTLRAAQQGSTVIRGIQMFLEQAAQQFEIWTGETAPRVVMEKAALEALAQMQCEHRSVPVAAR